MARKKVRCPLCGAANKTGERCRICFGVLPVPRNVARPSSGSNALPPLDAVSRSARGRVAAASGASAPAPVETLQIAPLTTDPVMSSFEPSVGSSLTPSAVAVADPPRRAPAPTVFGPPPSSRPEPRPPAPRSVVDDHDDHGVRWLPLLLIVGAVLVVIVGAVVVLNRGGGGSSSSGPTSTTVDHRFDKWIPFTDTAGRFAAEFPAKPAIRQQVTLTADGSGFPTTVWATGSLTTEQPAGDGSAIMLAELPAGALQRTTPDTLLLIIAGSLADQMQGTITHASKSTDGDRTQLDLRYDIPGGALLARVIVDTDRMWIVMSTGATPPAAAQKFLLHSFAIVN